MTGCGRIETDSFANSGRRPPTSSLEMNDGPQSTRSSPFTWARNSHPQSICERVAPMV